jgi:hypothetical protein
MGTGNKDKKRKPRSEEAKKKKKEVLGHQEEP